MRDGCARRAEDRALEAVASQARKVAGVIDVRVREQDLLDRDVVLRDLSDDAIDVAAIGVEDHVGEGAADAD